MVGGGPIASVPQAQANACVRRALERGICETEGCGGMRRMGVRYCYRCGLHTDLRPPRAGDAKASARGPPSGAAPPRLSLGEKRPGAAPPMLSLGEKRPGARLQV